MSKFKSWKTASLLALLALSLGGCHATSTSNNNASQTSQSNPPTSQSQAPTSQKQNLKNPFANQYQQTYHQLAQQNYQSGANPIVQVNQGKSTLNIKDWQSNHVKYSQLDRLNRPSNPATAYLESRNVANDQLRTQQTVKPTGWHQKKNAQGQMIINRGHIIAYSLSKGITLNGNYDPQQQSGDQNNLRNLFTQTAFCNQELQTIYESKVRDALKQGAKVIYQVVPIFQGNDLMAKGVWLQAVGTNGLNFNVYLYNVQPGFKFNYQTGQSQVDPAMQVPTPPNAPHFNDNHQSTMHHHRHHDYQTF